MEKIVAIKHISPGVIVFWYGDVAYRVGGEAHEQAGPGEVNYTVYTSLFSTQNEPRELVHFPPAVQGVLLRHLVEQLSERGFTVELV